MTKLRLHDTLTSEKIVFEPREGSNRLTLYVCGPTVYNYAHIGNARPVVVFDVLYRLLKRLYPNHHVVYARNVTDVDDKINASAIAQGVDISVITDRYAEIYDADMAALNALPPDLQPRATAHIKEMSTLIEAMVERGLAYESAGEVLFDVTAFEAFAPGAYGQLSKRDLGEMAAGARVEVAENKRGAADFVLWKPSKPGEPEWDGPVGLKGRPGWHIECSAMVEDVLGLPVDIHGGGHDLIFPHHTNEIAQSCAAHGQTDPRAFARYWMHNGFLDMSGEKMSKSLGNVVLVHELIKTYPGEVVRWALLSGHYRSPLDWTPDLLEQSRKNLDRLYGVLQRAEDIEPARTVAAGALDSLADDVNTPGAIAQLFSLASRLEKAMAVNDMHEAMGVKADLLQLAEVMGVLQQNPSFWFKGGANDALAAEVEGLIAERRVARQAKDWPEADRIRDRLNALNVVVMDNPTGATWRMKD